MTTSVPDAPGNKAVALFDSGTSYAFVQIVVFCCLPAVDVMHRYVPPEISKAIYGGVKGARFDSGLGQWVVPCDAEIDMALQIKSAHCQIQASSYSDVILHIVTNSTLLIHWTSHQPVSPIRLLAWALLFHKLYLSAKTNCMLSVYIRLC